MNDPATAFLLGPLVFIPELLSLGTDTNIVVFIASGLGTAMWASIVSVVGGMLKQ